MYAIIEDGSRQFKVSEGDLLRIDLIDVDDETKTVEFDRVLLAADGDKITVGTPVIEGAKVAAEITKDILGGKKVSPVAVSSKNHGTGADLPSCCHRVVDDSRRTGS